MATTDKHPPLDPRRFSTNKRVKAKTQASMGTAVKTASGAKKIKVGDKNTTSAKRESPPKTQADKRAAASMIGERNTEDKNRKLLKRGYMTQNESMILRRLKQTRKPVI